MEYRSRNLRALNCLAEVINTLYHFLLNVIFVCVFADARSYWFWICFSCANLLFFVVWRVPRILGFTILSIGFPYLLTLFSYCVHLVGGSTWIVLQLVQDLMEPKPIVELDTIYLGILLVNSNCFAIFFSSILVMSVQMSTWRCYCLSIFPVCEKFQKQSINILTTAIL